MYLVLYPVNISRCMEIPRNATKVNSEVRWHHIPKLIRRRKQCQEEHIAEGYKKRGVSAKTAKARAWATVNKETGGGKKSGSGRGKKESHESSRKGGRKG